MIKLLVLSVFLTVSAGLASTIQFSGLPANTQYGTYNGYAPASLDGAAVLLICDDYAHTTYMPSGVLTYSLSELVGLNPLQFARFDDPNHLDQSIVKYETAAVLLSGMSQNGPGSLLDLTADFQYALWKLFTPGVTFPNSTAQTLLNDAAYSVAHAGSSNDAIYSQLRIYTPGAGYASNQEFLQMVQSQNTTLATLATPEPPAVIAMAIGMAAIALSLAARRLLRRKPAAVTLGSIPRESER